MLNGGFIMPDAKCELCGEPMPPGEEMFKFHGYSGSCPKPPLSKQKTGGKEVVAMLERAAAEWRDTPNVGDKPLDVACYFMEHTLPKAIGEVAALMVLLRRVVGAWLYEAHCGDGILSDHSGVLRDVKAVLGEVAVPPRPVD